MTLRYLFASVFSIVLALQVHAQPDTIEFSLETPLRTAASFRYYSNPEHERLDLALRCFEIDPEDDTIDIVKKLNQIVDGAGVFVADGVIPDSANHVDSVTQEAKFVFVEKYPEIYVEKIGNKWLFSRSSIEQILELHKRTFVFGSDQLVDVFGPSGKKKYLGLYPNQLLGILILIFISYVVHRLLVVVLDKIVIRLLYRLKWKRIADKGVKPVVSPLSIFLVLWLVSIFIPVLQLPSNITYYTVTVLRTLLPFMATIVFYRLVDLVTIYVERIAEKTTSSLDDQLVPILRKTLRTFVVTIGTLVILDNLDVPILPLLTGLSIGGLAFALAAQDTIKNFFGSMMIFVDKPFQIGHWITSGEIDGTVEEVGFRSTRIRTFRNSVISVPNGKLADAVIDNHGLRVYRRFSYKIGLTYDTPPEKIETFVRGLEEIVKNHPSTRKDYYNIFFNEMGNFSLNILFYIFFQVPDWTAELRARHEVLLEIMKLAKKVGVEFAFPTQTLHLEGLKDSTQSS